MWQVLGAAVALGLTAPAAASVVVVSFSDLTNHSTYGSFSYDSSEAPQYITHFGGVDSAYYAATSDFLLTYAGNSYDIAPSDWSIQITRSDNFQGFGASIPSLSFGVGVNDPTLSSLNYLELPTSFNNDIGLFTDASHIFTVRIPIKFTFSAASVPEPASWAMMVGGFGLIGGALRSQRKVMVRFA